jgi:multiple sugar transport system permease protein
MQKRPSLFWHLPLIAIGLTMLLPLAFMITTALSPSSQGPSAGDSFWSMIVPRAWHWSSFSEVFAAIPFGRYYVNSLTVALTVTFGQVFTSACAAYAFSRLEWRGRDTLFLAYLATMMVPGVVTMLPNFIAMKFLPELLQRLAPWLDWLSPRVLGHASSDPQVGRLVGIDSYFALIVPMMFSAYGTFMLRQFFLTIPRELDEAAEIDGAGHWMTFSRVILPLSFRSWASGGVFSGRSS